MQLVDVAQYKPGCCVLGGGHERLVDFQRHMPAIDEGDRMYVSQQMIADAARLMGFIGPEEQSRYELRIKGLQDRIRELQGVEAELKELKRSVAATLQAGVVVDKRTGEIKPRLAPGQSREKVSV